MVRDGWCVVWCAVCGGAASSKRATCDSGLTPAAFIAAHSLLNCATQCLGVGRRAVCPPGVSIGALSTCLDASTRPHSLRWAAEAPARR